MSKLTKKQRKKLPKKDFAGPNKSYPIPDKKHAKAAIMLINKGKLTPSEKTKVLAKAKAKLKKKK